MELSRESSEPLLQKPMKIEEENMGPCEDPLPRVAVACYGTGHMLNDLTAACWFTYLLIFLTDIGLTPREAATVMLSGQVADGIATIIVGQLIDSFGHFKVWHAGGSLLVAVSFSSVFGGCMACALLGGNHAVAQIIGYSTFAAIFNVGWAATQVSHMSLFNCLTSNSSSQVALNSCRNAFTMFKWIAGVAIAVGICFVLVFLLGVKEPKLLHHREGSEEKCKRPSFKVWFQKLLYYQVAAVYMLTRLTTNVSQALLPFYLIDDLHMDESSKAVVPALIYSCSFLASIVLQELRWTSFQLKVVYTMGAALWVFSGAIFLLLPQSLESLVYLLAIFIGIGNAFMLVTATSMEGLLVSTNLSGCGFVYGSLSFMDKLACGIALYLIEGMNVQTRVCPSEDVMGHLLTFPAICHCSLIRVALALVPSSCAFLAWIITTTMKFEDARAKHLSAVTTSDLLNNSSLEAPLLLPFEGTDETPSDPLRLRGGKKATSSSSPCSIGGGGASSRSRGTHGNNNLEAPADEDCCTEIAEHGDEELVGPLVEEENNNNNNSMWRRLGQAMVGRWGSICTTHQQSWLH